LSYSDAQSGLSQRQLIVLAGLFAVILTAFGALSYLRALPVYATQKEVSHAIKTNQRIAAAAEDFQRLYPTEYNQLFNGRFNQLEVPALKDNVVGEFRSALVRLLRGKKAAILGAPDNNLAAIASARAIMISRLAVTDLKTCASYSQFAISPGWETDEDAMRLAAVIDSALLRAAHAGENAPSIARTARLDPETIATLNAAAARRGMTPAQMIIQRNENRIGLRESDRTRCIAGMLYFRAVADLPPADSAKVIAADLATSPLLGT
jgi:hypothetical protein